jgi:hypothetical protein
VKIYIDEAKVDVVPLNVCGVVFEMSYMYMMVVIFMRREKYYRLIKGRKSFIINAHKIKSKISLISAR